MCVKSAAEGAEVAAEQQRLQDETRNGSLMGSVEMEAAPVIGKHHGGSD